MADIGKGIYALLNGTSAITDDTSSRIRPNVLNQGETLPAITHQLVSQTTVYPLGGDSGLARARVQIDCYADTSIKAAELGDDVHAALSFYQGTVGGVVIRRALADANTRMEYEEPTDKSDQGRCRHSRDYIIWHLE